ncbi:cell wall metabolism sensor histidine kinase WalK [Ornithinibacillus massiliensis]|uniref:histidine kinase n=1 Tax=Ornithinibacillus massiliensis TaxID=1944633 RepID=A0ABS5M8R7_9BACI|nr:cell wall metabolism sensor histidine kinase WalK [Ornithinibacillus massiliensis]MBS3678709.1 cell wall metabolism sensor histidine kinase WalK [Ornithinibacillus massiliensis]
MHKVGFFRSIQLKLILIYILLILLAIQIIGSYFTTSLERELTSNFKSSIDGRIEVLSHYLQEAFNKERTDEEEPTIQEDVQGIIGDIETDSSWKNLIVVNNQSKVLATNNYSQQDKIGKKDTRDIIQKVLLFSDEQVQDRKDSDGNRIHVQATPLFDNEEKMVGVIYLEASLQDIYDQLSEINQIFYQGTIWAILVSAILGILVARAITKPVMEMRRQAQIMGKGDFTQKVNVYGTDEIGQLAIAFNDLNDQLKHSYAKTEEETRKLNSVIENMSDGVIATDETGAVTLMNEPAGILLGVNPEEIYGQRIMDVLKLDEKVVDPSELPENGSMIIDFSEDDDIFLIRANFSTVTDEDDDVTGFITVISDVTEQEKIEQERREFVSNVSHELRTPLTTMKSYMEALIDGEWKNEDIAPRFLEVTQNETERMIRMVNDLLHLSKMDNKEHQLQKERTEFIQLFHHVIDRFEMNSPEHIEIVRELPNEKLFVWIDQDKLIQVIDNIISNAIKYSPEGGKVTCRVIKQRHQILVSITDEGMGIAYDKLEKIFERFYRVDKARTRKLGGTGLGLAISKELVEAHHGRIWAKSKEGKGTTILFTLPLMGKKRRNNS